MNEVRVRFLASILEQLPLERIVEIHFFPSIRQGQVETGVAVIAAEPQLVGVAAVAADAEFATEAEQAEVAAELESVAEQVTDEIVTEIATEIADSASDDDSPYADAAVEIDVTVDVTEVEVVTAAPVAIDRHRHEVLTAVYRWTRKGPDRGKWEVDVKSEADAPLPTVDLVVRGVRDRSGEEIEPQRYDNEGIRAVMASPAWPTTA
jgi:hypothetical protein